MAGDTNTPTWRKITDSKTSIGRCAPFKKPIPDRAALWALLDYDHLSGEFRWRLRPVRGGKERTDNSWNSRYAGKIAGCLCPDGYIRIKVEDRLLGAHRIAFKMMTGRDPFPECDHRNTCRSDNRWKNLREATGTQNSANQRLSSQNTSGLKGASWHKGEQRWRASISIKNCTKHIGYFDTAEEAHGAYRRAAKEIFGEFARFS